MSITTRDYYKGLISIGNADAKEDRALLGNSDQLGDLIVKYEREVMVKIFGWSLYKLFIENLELDVNGVYQVKDNVDPKWGELLNGKEYTINGVPVVWRGLRFEDVKSGGVVKQSLLANYIYCQYIDNDELQHSGVGLVITKGKNAVRVSGRGKYATAWNEFVKMTCSYGVNYGERSLYQFIMDQNQEEHEYYPNWDRFEFELKNRYGL